MKNFDDVVKDIEKMFCDQNFPKQLSYQLVKSSGSKPSDRWSILNRLIMFYVGGTTDARTYSQWRSVGRYVRKGEKAFGIIAPVTRKIKTIDVNTGLEKEEVRIISFRSMPVFSYEATEGSDLPEEKPDSVDISVSVKNLAKAVKSLGCSIEYKAFDGSVLGFYQPATNRIVLSDFSLITLSHESGHFVVHEILKEEMGRSQEECVVELAALVICELSGEQGYEKQTYDYLKFYSSLKSSSEPKEVIGVISKIIGTVEKVVNVLFEAMQK